MRRYLQQIILVPMGLCLIFVGDLMADETLPELKKLRVIYFDQLDKVTRPVDLKYGQALVALQKSLIAEEKIEAALAVKLEINRLKEELAGNAAPRPVAPISKIGQAEPEPTKMVEKTSNPDRKWRGDFEKKEVGGDTIYIIKADENDERMIYTELDNAQDEFDNRLVWRFDYLSEDYVGEGFDIRMAFTDLKRIVTVGTAIRPNGNWIERTRPVTDLKNEDRVVVQIVIKPGKGEVELKNIELFNR